PVFNNHFERYFQDQAQKKWDKWIQELEKVLINFNPGISKNRIRRRPNTTNRMARLTQSIIEVMGKSAVHKLDVMAWAIQQEFQNADENRFCDFGDIAEMLCQYIQLDVGYNSDIKPNICFVIANRIIVE